MMDATCSSHAGVDLIIKLLHQLFVVFLDLLHDGADMWFEEVDIFLAFLVFGDGCMGFDLRKY